MALIKGVSRFSAGLNSFATVINLTYTELGLTDGATLTEVKQAIANYLEGYNKNEDETIIVNVGEPNFNINFGQQVLPPEPSQTVKISLSSEQIKTLNSNPITVISSPGVGKMINIENAFLIYKHNGESFTSDTLRLFYGSSLVTYFISNFSILSGNINTIRSLDYTRNDLGDISAINDKPIVLRLNADSAVGNGTLDLYITYRIITL